MGAPLIPELLPNIPQEGTEHQMLLPMRRLGQNFEQTMAIHTKDFTTWSKLFTSSSTLVASKSF
ncbi:MAG: hypothetical protein Q9M45_00775 [Robiginitomaculum sp.]|nr:hypothetical protein [Robiginitomaculum sp.]